MAKVHPDKFTAIKIDDNGKDVENNNPNNNNNDEEKEDKKSSMSMTHLYRPHVISKEESIRLTSSTNSLANGRRWLVKGNTIDLPGKEFLEDITKCFSNTNHVHIRQVLLPNGTMGFKVANYYEVLNDKQLRICVLANTTYFSNGYNFFIANPFGVDAFVFKDFVCKPSTISGPGMPVYNVKHSLKSLSVIYANKDKTFQKRFTIKVVYFPYWIFSFYKGKSGPNIRYTSGPKGKKTVARITRDSTMETEQFRTMKLEFSPSLSTEDRIGIFSASLYTLSHDFRTNDRLGDTIKWLAFYAYGIFVFCYTIFIGWYIFS